MADDVKRKYASARRDAQALATRVAILDAALRRFTASGYTATTVQAVADEAGVAVQTVYAVFGNKRELLRQLLESAITGDASPAPLTSRPEPRAKLQNPDPRRRAEIAAGMATEISQRLAPLARVLLEAASAEPQFTETAKRITEQRRADMAQAAKHLTGRNPADSELEELMGTLYILYSPETFLALTTDFGWSINRYQRWLTNMLYLTVTGTS